MSVIKNPPAFPSEQHETQDGTWNQTYCDGMSLRDWFAGQAIAGLLSSFQGVNCVGNETKTQGYARRAYEYADAMLSARALEGEG